MKFSFIVPMYDSATYLAKTLDSIVAMVGQKKEAAEVLLLDDGSTDDTVEIARKYATDYTFFKVFANPHQGVSATRNFGISKATGDYITFIDSDDIFAADFIEILESLTIKKPDIILADIETLATETFVSDLTASQKISLFKLINRGRGNTGIGSKFFKRSFLLEYALSFAEDIAISEDALFNYQAIDLAKSIVLTPQKFYYVLDSHTLPYYNPKILNSELKYRQETAKFFAHYFTKDDAGELQWTDNKIKLLGFIKLVDRYFGPRYNIKEISLREAASSLREIAEKYEYTTSFNDERHDDVLGLRYRVFRRLLAKRLYRTTLIFNKYMDKIKKTQRWK